MVCFRSSAWSFTWDWGGTGAFWVGCTESREEREKSRTRPSTATSSSEAFYLIVISSTVGRGIDRCLMICLVDPSQMRT